MDFIHFLGISIAILFVTDPSFSVELTFELEDNAKECFYERIMNETKCTLEFQVVTGGHYDVDVVLKNPNGEILYDEKKKQYDSHTFDSKIPGEYTFCFSNEFSSVTHKTVYFDFQTGEEPSQIPGIGNHHTALTMIESSAVQIHESLKVIIDYQTHHRLREATSRDMAEYLNERVQYWSIGQGVIIMAMSLLQVYILRNFFAEKRDRL
ncbi:transmembrane emp24 domain-containing protein 7-like [Hydractinia symbiolongicarpus]|uniref:transmembrane emp24 domain-containing protein 7-like n=1 Tax=Hydractinia symbiolongicarpus TaxID=13093 RepID=UPI00254D8D5C|nr:transmembrane emp24 domain-containing protein 7-like [Hydractinia symbiolongicarpus]